jgi:nucleotide-binding universal stress UspA family protein
MARPYRIVVGYDGSEAAERALDRAADLVGYGSTVSVVFVAPDVERVAASASVLAHARERLHRRGVLAETVPREGSPADELIAAALERDADLLVVGAAKTALQRLVLGSVSTTLVHRAPCDVLVARSHLAR